MLVMQTLSFFGHVRDLILLSKLLKLLKRQMLLLLF